MITVGQLLWLYLLLFCFMIENFNVFNVFKTFNVYLNVFKILLYLVETSQLICSADHLSGFNLVHGTDRNFRTTGGFLL